MKKENKSDLTCAFHEDLDHGLDRIIRRVDAVQRWNYCILFVVAINLFLSGWDLSHILKQLLKGV